MIRDKMFFEFAGIDCRVYGILNVNLSGGMLDEPFSAPISVIEQNIRGRDKPYFKRKERDTLSFQVSFAFEEQFTNAEIQDVARWLVSHDTYQPLSFVPQTIPEGYVKKIYYAMVIDDSRMIHNALKQGYITLTFKCDAPYAYLSTTTSEEYVFTGDQNPLVISNSGDLDVYPVIELTKTSDGMFSIENETTQSILSFYDKQSGSALVKFNGSAFNGDTIQIGDEIYEFMTLGGTPDVENIIVDISGNSARATGRLNFVNPVKDKDSVSVGQHTYEFTNDEYYRVQNIKIDISSYTNYATGVLTFTDLPEPLSIVTIGNSRYVFDKGTSGNLIKMPRHGLDQTGGNYMINIRGKQLIPPEDITIEDANFILATGATAAPGDVIEIYNGRASAIAGEGSGGSIILTSNTFGLRTGDYVKAESGNFGRIVSVSHNARITLQEGQVNVSAGQEFIPYPRIALRAAEGTNLQISNVVNIGTTTEECAENFKRAINIEGIPGIDYNPGIIQNQIVGATRTANEVFLTSKFVGTEGNQVKTGISEGFQGGFANSTLTGGTDCPTANARQLLIEAIQANLDSEVLIANFATGFVEFEAKIAGTPGNGIIGFSNNLNMVWVADGAFSGGTNATKEQCADILRIAIGDHSTEVNAVLSGDTLTLTHKSMGLNTNIFLTVDALNIFTSGSHFTGGRNELILGEELVINNERQQVESNIVSRYDTFNHKYLKLVPGNNNLKISGDANIKFIITPKVY